MGEELLPLFHSASDRAVEQAIVALKKGSNLLKYGRRGKPKFCPFRLSTDEKFLVWYSGQEERQLRLSSVTNVVRGQTSKQLQPERESQCLSLVYANGERSLDLICKDKEQAETWYSGLKAVTSRTYTPKKQRGIQSCINSPASFIRRKQIVGLLEEKIRSSQVHSLSGSPPHEFTARCASDGLSCSSDSFYSQSSLSSTQSSMDFLASSSPFLQQEDPNNQEVCASPRIHTQFSKTPPEPSETRNHILRDILIWGEKWGSENGGMEVDAVWPKVLDSTMMFDLHSISLGQRHAALVTKQGEVFCWGEGKRGRLGHKVDIDIPSPKIVDSLIGVHVDSVSCGEYQTCALTSTGEVYTWGDTYSTNLTDSHDKTRTSVWLPHRLYGSLDGVIISRVACGAWHTAILSTSGKLFTYGDGTFGVLGHGDLNSVSHPKEVESLKGLHVRAVACGTWHTAAIVEVIVDRWKFNHPAGKLFTWGDGDKGKLGHIDKQRQLKPTCVAQLVDHDFVQVSCGLTLTVGLSSTGRVYTMGSPTHGQLGGPQLRDKSIVCVQGKLADDFVREISSGSYHVAVLTSRGNVYTWGRGRSGQLGLGDTKDRNLPTLVEALRGRQVENVTCGSSSTAAICLHKPVSSTDQSACKGCNMIFGFTRKKHNCYNCGLLFCGACSNKKSTNASRAPSKSKPFRVCNHCFNQLCKPLDLDNNLKFETNSPRPMFMSENATSQVTSARNHSDEGGPLNVLPRWGQVSCPENFKETSGAHMTTEVYLSIHELSSRSTVSNASSSASVENNLLQSEKFLIEEIEKLKTQVDDLEKLYRTRKERIKENQQKTEEAWSLAKDEAAKSKAAKEVIQALTSRICAISDKFAAEQVVEDRPIASISCEPRGFERQEEKNLSSLCSSPIVFSNKLRSLRNGDSISRNGKESYARVVPPMVEWVEQYQPGIYLTFVTLPNGKTGLRRVRFSRKKFDDNEAKRWWDENQQIVCRHYGIDSY